MKNRFNIFRPASLYFWRDSNGNEVDFLIREAGEIHLVETKYSFTPTAQFFKGIQFFRTAAPLTKGKNIVLYAGKELQQRQDLEVLPWKKLLTL